MNYRRTGLQFLPPKAKTLHAKRNDKQNLQEDTETPPFALRL
jgi:hypothetical protein